MAVESREGKPAAPRPGGPGTVRGMLTLEGLRDEIEQGTIDTVVAAFTDMQGRLMGKRIQGEYFLEEAAEDRRLFEALVAEASRYRAERVKLGS